MTDATHKLKVLKKLSPSQPGARKLALRYGKNLVCVRHRTDPTGVFRYTTVELLVDKTPSRPRTDRMVRVKIDYKEAPLRRVVRAAGATWDPDSRLWNMSRRVAGVLNLLDRIVEN